MDWKAKAFTTKSEDLRVNTGTHMGEGENSLPRVILLALCVHTYTHTNLI